jgi:activator of HSP90 ATPase
VTQRIHQVVNFPASSEQIYEYLLDAERFSSFTGAPAVIDRVPGGEFSLFGGQIVGRNIELIPSELIVQAWRVGGWGRGEYSIARFELANDSGACSLTFDHLGFPQEAFDDLDAGWHQMYWEPIRRELVA